MSLHADARRLLEGWRAPDPEQESLRRSYLAHLDAHPPGHDDAMLRTCLPDHLTASVLVCTTDGAQVLLTLHGRLGRWLQTGGHCEPGDATLAGAAAREGREESGIEEVLIDPDPVLLSRHGLPCGPEPRAHHLDVQFVATVPDGAAPVISAESRDLAFFDARSLPEPTDDSVRALVRAGTARVRAGRRHPSAADQPSR